MIFCTVGDQIPFDRLVNRVDAWAGEQSREDVFAQVGRGGVRPNSMESVERMGHRAFRDAVHASRLIITHAGMGTILTALELGRPVIVVPRQAKLGETRSDHQFGTARVMQERALVQVAWDEEELGRQLMHGIPASEVTPIASHGSSELLERIHRMIHDLEEPDASGQHVPHSFPSGASLQISTDQQSAARRAA